MYDRKVKLIAHTFTQDASGEFIENTPTERYVWAEVREITRGEWLAAGQQGYNPDTEIVMQTVNYNGEAEVEVDGKVLSVYRTYTRQNSDEVELYCEKKVGANG